MTSIATMPPRSQTRGEEMANSVSHGIALLLAIAALPVLVVGAVRDGGAAGIVGASIFGATMVLLYLASTIYHALPAGRAKRVFQVLDHCAIFLLIAGTYTPFVLGALKGSWGWSLFGVVWGLALSGIVLKAVFGNRYQFLSTVLYLGMGWLVVIAAHPLFHSIEKAGLAWLIGGGVAYTAGVIFFVLDERMRYAHFIWHVFVVMGTACHFVAVYGYAAR